MTWWLACVWCKILAMCWDKHHQMTYASKNFLIISIKHKTSAVLHFSISLTKNNDHRTDSLYIVGQSELPTTCSYTQQENSSLKHVCWQLFIPLWPVGCYTLLGTVHFSLSSSPPCWQQQVMPPQTPQPSAIESKASRTMGASSNVPLAETQQQCRHQCVHRNAAITATENLTQNVHSKTGLKTGCNNIRK
jgi:hypothetical protein